MSLVDAPESSQYGQEAEDLAAQPRRGGEVEGGLGGSRERDAGAGGPSRPPGRRRGGRGRGEAGVRRVAGRGRSAGRPDGRSRARQGSLAAGSPGVPVGAGVTTEAGGADGGAGRWRRCGGPWRGRAGLRASVQRLPLGLVAICVPWRARAAGPGGSPVDRPAVRGARREPDLDEAARLELDVVVLVRPSPRGRRWTAAAPRGRVGRGMRARAARCLAARDRRDRQERRRAARRRAARGRRGGAAGRDRAGIRSRRSSAALLGSRLIAAPRGLSGAPVRGADNRPTGPSP